MNSKSILLLGIEGTQTLPIAKSLYKAGYHLVGTYGDKYGYGVHTKYIHDKIKIEAKTDAPEYFARIIDLIKEKKIDVMLPLGDLTAAFLSKNKTELSEYALFTMPNYDVFMKGYDKNQLMALCKEKNYPHPITIDLSKPYTKDDIETFPYPAIIKPNITTGGRGMTMAHNCQDFFNKIEEVEEKHGPCHLQQFIPAGGRQIKVEVFVDAKHGKYYSSVIHKQRFYPENGGSSSCNVTIKDDQLANMCYHILKEIGWEGFADFDLIEDSRDNVLKVMEINPRVPACLKSAVESGMDYGNMMVDYALGKEIKNYEDKPGAKLRHIGFEMLWFFSSKNRFRAKPNWFHWIDSRLTFQDFSFCDQGPFWWGTYGNIRKMRHTDVMKEKSGF